MIHIQSYPISSEWEGGRGGGVWGKKQNFLTFSFDPFATVA